jgi:hypothetical protein
MIEINFFYDFLLLFSFIKTVFNYNLSYTVFNNGTDFSL